MQLFADGLHLATYHTYLNLSWLQIKAGTLKNETNKGAFECKPCRISSKVKWYTFLSVPRYSQMFWVIVYHMKSSSAIVIYIVTCKCIGSMKVLRSAEQEGFSISPLKSLMRHGWCNDKQSGLSVTLT